MAPLVNLLSCSIIEKDWNGDVLWIWSYPCLSQNEKSYVTRKWNLCENKENGIHQWFVGARRESDVWIYIHSSEALAASKLPRVKRCAVVLSAKDFNPQDYRELCRTLSYVYCDTGDPMQLLKYYLLAFTEGTLTRDTSREINSLGVNNHVFRGKWMMNNNHARKLINTFKLETILIYTALLLKKRIVVYHHSLEELFRWIETFPTLMKHRRVTDNLFPWIDLVKDELAQLKNNSYYVAGCRDSSIASKTELFDLLVNIPAREITVAPHAKESLSMTKAHKEIALFMVQLCKKRGNSDNNVTNENGHDNNDQNDDNDVNDDDEREKNDDDDDNDSIIREIAEKTQDLVSQLNALETTESSEGKKMICLKRLREQRTGDLPSSVENFFINLAIAENLLPLDK